MVHNLSKIDTHVFHIVGDAADSLGYPCYAVGGYVRDLLLGRHSKDIDFVSVGQDSGINIAREVAHRLGSGAHVSIFRTYGTAQVKRGELELEFVATRRESYKSDSRNPIVEEGTLDDDISRRDFTINAMAVQVNAVGFGSLVDKFNGLQDLRDGIIRTPLDPDITFSDDPLRMMRAIRFATQLQFTIEPVTFKAISRNASRIEIITRERIATELNKILLAPIPSIGIRLLSDCGLLALILPELEAMKGVEIIKGRGHKDNFQHTLAVLDSVAQESDNLWLRWAALLHDIAKPVTKRWDEKVGWSFHNHNFVGAKMVPKIFRALKMPMGEPMRYVAKMVELHMRPIALVEDEVTDSAVRRLITEAAEDLPDLMILCRADITSRNQEKVKRHLQNFENVLRKMEDVTERDHLRNFAPPILGSEIMEVFALTPSRAVGDIKTKIKDAVLDGIIPNDHDAAFEYMLSVAAEMGLKPVNK
ncbi:MAG: CCA tRNA nucleotidyltransferase [Paramuribaculum sp.]|nr:CCA tRNA nucleotidyltransferase [Paramuribaculum sp.]